MNVVEEVRAAEERIRAHVRETPLEASPAFAGPAAELLLKLENQQLTGSFKVRGALSKLLSLTPEERGRGVVAASSGNHGAGVAYGMRVLGCGGLVFVPEGADPDKIARIRALGAEVVVHGTDCALTEAHARRHASEHGLVYISPYNDPAVVGGQGTIGVELARQTGPGNRIDVVFVALGGGGLISGIAGWLKARDPAIELVGCSPEASPIMAESLRAGRIVFRDSLPTLSDGTAGGIEEGAITFDLCRELVDRTVLVSEEEIAAAMRLTVRHHGMLIEGAAGCALAAWLKEREDHAKKRVVVVLCGANVSPETLKNVL
ncbi:MAG: threonine/serine dehydratase [Planctomycetota bacterium]|nr:threonine/serine dehydratase [Planctomycetota bacterium]